MILTRIQQQHARCVRWLCGQCHPQVDCICVAPSANPSCPTPAKAIPAGRPSGRNRQDDREIETTSVLLIDQAEVSACRAAIARSQTAASGKRRSREPVREMAVESCGADGNSPMLSLEAMSLDDR